MGSAGTIQLHGASPCMLRWCLTSVRHLAEALTVVFTTLSAPLARLFDRTDATEGDHMQRGTHEAIQGARCASL